MNLRTSLTAAALALTAATSFAQIPAPKPAPATPAIDARAANQEKRIEQGVKSGQLTATETLKVEREQKHIAVVETKAKADGVVTPAEHKKLHRMQHAASKDIAKQKHDAQTTTSVPVAAPTR